MKLSKSCIMSLTLGSMLIISNAAFAYWSVIEYKINGEYHYGIRDGSSSIKLDLKKEKQAKKAAKGMNKADAIDKKR